MDLQDLFGIPKVKTEKVKIEKAKSLSPFDYITLLTTKKTKWDKLTEKEKKDFNPFMITKFLSYDHQIVDIINYIAKYTMSGELSKEQIWGMFYTILPKMRLNVSYIKKLKKDKDPLTDTYIKCLCKEFHCSIKEAEEYCEILSQKTSYNPIQEKEKLIKKYGYER